MSKEKFDAGLDIFQVHFRNNPIVPGVLLLIKGLEQREDLAVHPTVTVENLTFNSFVRPEQLLAYVTDGRYTAISADDALCCTFSVHGNDEILLAHSTSGESCKISTLIAPARESTYWFLPERVNMNVDGTVACSKIDMAEIIQQHEYLTQISNPALLVLIEAAGNLALAMQQLRDGGFSTGRYVFVKFDLLVISLHAANPAAKFQIETHVRRFGSIIAWDASISNESGVCVLIRNAISIKRAID
jgi:hypothetical protein